MEEKILALYELGHGKDRIAIILKCTSADVRKVLMKHNKSRSREEVKSLRKKNNLNATIGGHKLNKRTVWDL